MNKKKKKRKMTILVILNLNKKLSLKNNNKNSGRKNPNFLKKIKLVKIYQIYLFSIIIKNKITLKELKKKTIILMISINYKMNISNKKEVEIQKFKKKEKNKE
jgi:hypothetical protein